MSATVLRLLLLANDIHIEMPKQVEQPVAQVRVEPTTKAGKLNRDCYPWFPERNYQCPSAGDKK